MRIFISKFALRSCYEELYVEFILILTIVVVVVVVVSIQEVLII